jgi:hypothetical protein
LTPRAPLVYRFIIRDKEEGDAKPVSTIPETPPEELISASWVL